MHDLTEYLCSFNFWIELASVLLTACWITNRWCEAFEKYSLDRREERAYLVENMQPSKEGSDE